MVAAKGHIDAHPSHTCPPYGLGICGAGSIYAEMIPSGTKIGGALRDNPAQRDSVKELARRYAPLAIETLARIMASNRASGSARVAAAITILDRAHGKPSQFIEAEVMDRTDYVIACEPINEAEWEARYGLQLQHFAI